MSNTLPSMDDMLKAGVHFGHQSSRWHPKMEPYIYTVRNGVHVLDLKKTHKGLEQACNFLKKTAADGGDILFVGTKTQAQALIEKYAKDAGVLYMKGRWMGGLLTNYQTVKLVIKHYLDLIQQRDSGGWDKYIKKEQVDLAKELEKLEGIVSGLGKMTGLPKAIFIVDIKKEKTALLEAAVCKIPIVAICDTNVNPSKVTHVIPANDDATRGLDLLIKTVAAACKEGMKNRIVVSPKKPGVKPADKKPVAKKSPLKKAIKAVKESPSAPTSAEDTNGKKATDDIKVEAVA